MISMLNYIWGSIIFFSVLKTSKDFTQSWSRGLRTILYWNGLKIRTQCHTGFPTSSACLSPSIWHSTWHLGAQKMHDDLTTLVSVSTTAASATVNQPGDPGFPLKTMAENDGKRLLPPLMPLTSIWVTIHFIF